ncbi:GDSL-type esterase/lipase family protein [Adhaeribacter terreus]|uniref:GDSL-type esterase/lipase family protein n=1 Tax=Adhaeribacter terreus TaxID=529703 RepID=A0ABW0EBP7_9BACT
MIKPFRSLLLLLYVGLLLAGAFFLLPAQIPLPNGYSLRFFTLESLLDTKGKQYADISDIEQKFKPAEEKVAISKNAIVSAAKTAIADTLESRFKIQFPAGNDTAFYTFFRHLQRLKTSEELVRALHYGDSQIEGDRITAFLRNKFQNRFGGCGVGLVPLQDALGNRTSLQIKSDEAWKRVRAYGPDYSKRVPRHYGIMGSYYNFSFSYTKTIPGDSTAADSLSRQPKFITKKRSNIWVEYAKAHSAYARDSRFENFKLLYSNPEAPVILKIQTQKDSIRTFELPVTSEPTVFEMPFSGNFKKLRLSFEGTKSPEFYGAALDCNSGVVIDNMPFRGSSGTEFVRMNKETLRAQFKQLNVKFIILQYGVNVVPHVIKDYGYYEKQFYTQLKLLRELAPEASILVVGVSDVSRKEGEVYTTYPNVEKIRDAQRNAAFKAGCAFWDLYTAMGGKDSMPSWVFAKPALANKDFTHFTPKGAQLVAEMLFKSLMYEYEKFSRR